jgi:hypothetical protein
LNNTIDKEYYRYKNTNKKMYQDISEKTTNFVYL